MEEEKLTIQKEPNEVKIPAKLAALEVFNHLNFNNKFHFASIAGYFFVLMAVILNTTAGSIMAVLFIIAAAVPIVINLREINRLNATYSIIPNNNIKKF